MFTPKLFTELKKYSKHTLSADLFAGLTVGVVALSLALAFAIARTATNGKSGDKTSVPGMLHVVTLAILLLLFAPMAKMIPLASLAGMLLVVSYNMSEIHHFVSIFKGRKSDSFVFVLTFLLSRWLPLTRPNFLTRSAREIFWEISMTPLIEQGNSWDSPKRTPLDLSFPLWRVKMTSNSNLQTVGWN